ncbi:MULTISPECIES: DUF6882 domain-containing protein [Xanthomonas]|uniref:DUF6882 domain-containing protein n=1 Tax=Xanthomonas TaxID=338 RepID=UPI001263878A|nr:MULTISPECIES: DUF6882 domain-containing protein [Xanthomonas]KAB7779747.1 hypothetical protein CEK65_04485 [Xanthomonas sp. LMG 12459]MCW0465501.1 hypothetical protein [Xanthomonas sacchari]
MSPAFQAALARHIGSAYARQLALADVLAERRWQMDLGEGQVYFGEDLQFPIQLLGTAAEASASWLWAWANTASNLPPALLADANALRAHGEREGIAELAAPSSALGEDGGHQIALLAGALRGRCYYRAPYDGGALFFLLEDVPAAVFAPCDDARVLRLLGELPMQFELDHRAMTDGFLADQGYALQRDAAQTVATRGNTRIVLAFDAQARLTGIQGQLAPAQAAAVTPKPAPVWQFWKRKR